MSTLFCWPCSISIHLSPRSVTAGVRPFPLAMQHFYSFLKQFTVRGSQFFFIMCPPFLSLLALFRWPCSISLSPFCPPSCWSLCPPFLPSVSFVFGLVSLLFFIISLSPVLSPFSLCLQSCLTSCWSLCPSCLPSVPFLSPFLLVIVSALSLFLFPFVSLLVFLLVGHCVHIASLLVDVSKKWTWECFVVV